TKTALETYNPVSSGNYNSDFISIANIAGDGWFTGILALTGAGSSGSWTQAGRSFMTDDDLNRATRMAVHAQAARLRSFEMSEATASEVVSATEVKPEPGLNLAQTIFVIQVLRNIERHVHRLNVLAADDAGALHDKLDAAVQRGNVDKAFLLDLRDKLAISQQSSSVAFLVGNLLTYLGQV